MGLKVPKAFNYPLPSRQGWIYSQRTDGHKGGEGVSTVGTQTMLTTEHRGESEEGK